jgi:hypothetical protein
MSNDDGLDRSVAGSEASPEWRSDFGAVIDEFGGELHLTLSKYPGSEGSRPIGAAPIAREVPDFWHRLGL